MFKTKLFPCPYLNFVGCEKNCLDNCTQNNCMCDFAKNNIDDIILELCLQDSNAHGHLNVVGIEAEITILNSIDHRMELGGEKTSKQLREIRNLHGPILPFEVTKQAIGLPYTERASEWGCAIARILAKVDNSKVGDFPDAVEAVIGSACHAIFNQQHKPASQFVHNATLLSINEKYPGGLAEIMDRKKYCEKTIGLCVGKHNVSGHPDAILYFPQDPDYAIISFDKKHARYQAYEKKAYERQHIAYCLGVAQLHNLEPKYLFGITAKRPFTSVEYLRREERYHITRIKNDPENRLIKEFYERCQKSVEKQAEILHNKNALLALKFKKMGAKRGCINHQVIDGPRPCFNREICNYLCNKCSKENKSLLEVLDEFGALPDKFIVPGC